MSGFENELYEAVFEAAKPHLGTRDNLVHTLISLDYARELLKKEGGRPEIVIPAILLHDIGWSRVPEELHLTAIGPKATTPEARDAHEREGALMAVGILSELGFNAEDTEKIAHIISGHDTGTECSSLEEAIVRDSDKLFRFSDRGFGIIQGWYGYDPPMFLKWFADQIPEWFLTGTGRALADAEAAKRKEELA